MRRACLDSIFKLHIGDDFSQLVLSVETTPGFLCALDEFEHHGERGLVGQAALRADRSMTNGREGAFDRIRGPQMFPVLGGKIIECQQHVAIFFEAADSLVVFGFVKFDEMIKGRLGILARLGHPDVLQGGLGLRLDAFRQFVEHVRRLVHLSTAILPLREDASRMTAVPPFEIVLQEF